MILQALYQLAQNEGLTQDPDFEPRAVAWLVHVSKDGKLIGVRGTHYIPPEEQNKKKPRRIPKMFNVPREKAVTSGDRAFLLFGKSEYVFGQDPEPDPSEKRSSEKLASRFALFRKRVKECVDGTQGDEGVLAVWTALEDIAAARQGVVLPDGYLSNDLFAFVYSPDVDRLVSDRPRVRSYWKRMREPGLGEGGVERQCLVSALPFVGEVVNFPQVKNVPGKNTAKGISLVSFNKIAFESYSWKGNDNAPISRDAAEACSTALNRLLHPAYPDPHQPGQSLPSRHLRLSADTAVCFWSAETSGDEFCSVFAGLLEANPAVVKDLYQSLWRGRLAEIEDTSAFYALILTGTQGRAIVRDWFESTVARVARNLALHFSDLNIVRNTPKPKERDLPPQVPLTLLLRSLAVRGAAESVPAPAATELLEAALRGTPYPFSILQRALERARAEVGAENIEGVEGYQAKERSDARAALIKAVLNRRKRFFFAHNELQGGSSRHGSLEPKRRLRPGPADGRPRAHSAGGD